MKKSELEAEILRLHAVISEERAETGRLASDLRLALSATSNDRIEALEEEVSDLKHDLEQVNDDREDVRRELKDAEEEIQELRNEVENRVDPKDARGEAFGELADDLERAHTLPTCVPFYPMNPWDCPACAVLKAA